MRDRAHRGPFDPRRREPREHQARTPAAGNSHAHRRGHPLRAERRHDRRPARGEGADQSRELRRQEEVRRAGVRRCRVRSGAGARRLALSAARPPLQGARARASHRHESRLPLRPHHESFRRHSPRHGGERPRVPGRVRGRGLLRRRLQHEGEQRPGGHPGLSPAGGAARSARPWPPRLSLPHRRDGGRRCRRRSHQERDRDRCAARGRHRGHDSRLAHRAPGDGGAGGGNAGAALRGALGSCAGSDRRSRSPRFRRPVQPPATADAKLRCRGPGDGGRPSGPRRARRGSDSHRCGGRGAGTGRVARTHRRRALRRPGRRSGRPRRQRTPGSLLARSGSRGPAPAAGRARRSRLRPGLCGGGEAPGGRRGRAGPRRAPHRGGEGGGRRRNPRRVGAARSPRRDHRTRSIARSPRAPPPAWKTFWCLRTPSCRCTRSGSSPPACALAAARKSPSSCATDATRATGTRRR